MRKYAIIKRKSGHIHHFLLPTSNIFLDVINVLFSLKNRYFIHTRHERLYVVFHNRFCFQEPWLLVWKLRHTQNYNNMM